MSEAEIYANAPRLEPELTARLIEERGRLQSPDDLADAKLDADTLIRIARRAGLDPALRCQRGRSRSRPSSTSLAGSSQRR